MHMHPLPLHRLLRLLPYAAVLVLLLLGGALYSRTSESGLHLASASGGGWWHPKLELAPEGSSQFYHSKDHPIAELIRRANQDFEVLKQKETFDLPSAAHAYREKRGRHPPPGFGKWWQYAHDHGVVMVEEFWDQIYHDLTPMWALDPKEMLDDVHAQDNLIKIRNGRATHTDGHFWMPIWHQLVNDIAWDLPDMDFAMNVMDEPRLFIPWEDMTGYVEKERRERWINPVAEVIETFSAKPQLSDNATHVYPWNGAGPMWPQIAKVCPPDSLARLAPVETNFNHPPNLTIENMMPHSLGGYVSNFTMSTSLCHQPDLQDLHGFVIEPISIKTGSKLLPMFGSSKLSVNSEILLPATMYYKGDPRFTTEAAPVPWEKKTNSMIWRGLASGGRNKEDNWKGFHRHRLVSMLNGSQAIAMPTGSGFIDIQNLPLETWKLQTWDSELTAEPRNVAMGKWLQSWSDVSFTELACFPKAEGLGCPYTDYLFKPSERLTLDQQHQHKYLVDVDGNSFSGRYRDFLSSGSLPLKATIFREWHDSRLVPWKHFVPMDNRLMDIYGIMEFFLGGSVPVDSEERNRTIAERDVMAKKIALDGRDWAKKALRVEDMRVYTYRLLLEYARVMDQRRQSLGWVEDIKNHET